MSLHSYITHRPVRPEFKVNVDLDVFGDVTASETFTQWLVCDDYNIIPFRYT